MPFSECFYVATQLDSTEYYEVILPLLLILAVYSYLWLQFSAPYLSTFVFCSIMSTLVLYSSGSILPRRNYTWIATWEWFKDCYHTPL